MKRFKRNIIIVLSSISLFFVTAFSPKNNKYETEALALTTVAMYVLVAGVSFMGAKIASDYVLENKDNIQVSINNLRETIARQAEYVDEKLISIVTDVMDLGYTSGEKMFDFVNNLKLYFDRSTGNTFAISSTGELMPYSNKYYNEFYFNKAYDYNSNFLPTKWDNNIFRNLPYINQNITRNIIGSRNGLKGHLNAGIAQSNGTTPYGRFDFNGSYQDNSVPLELTNGEKHKINIKNIVRFELVNVNQKLQGNHIFTSATTGDNYNNYLGVKLNLNDLFNTTHLTESDRLIDGYTFNGGNIYNGNTIQLEFDNRKLITGNDVFSVIDNYSKKINTPLTITKPIGDVNIQSNIDAITQNGVITFPKDIDFDNVIDNAIDENTGSIVIDKDYVLGDFDSSVVIPPGTIGGIDFPEFDDGGITAPEISDKVSGGLLGSLFGWLINKLLSPLFWLGRLIMTGFNSIYNLLNDLFTGVLTIPDILNGIKDFIMAFPSTLWGHLLNIGDFIIGLPGAIVGGIGDLLVGLPGFILSIPGYLSDILTEILSFPLTFYNALVDALTWTFGIDIEKLKIELDDFYSTIKNRIPIFYEIIDLFTSLFSSINSNIPNFSVKMPALFGGGTHSVFDVSMIDPFMPTIRNITSAFIWLAFLRKYMVRLAYFRQ